MHGIGLENCKMSKGFENFENFVWTVKTIATCKVLIITTVKSLVTNYHNVTILYKYRLNLFIYNFSCMISILYNNCSLYIQTNRIK